MKIHQIDKEDMKLYEKITVPLGDLTNIAVLFQRVRINLRDAVGSENEAEKKRDIENIKKFRETISEEADKFEKTILTDEGR